MESQRILSAQEAVVGGTEGVPGLLEEQTLT